MSTVETSRPLNARIWERSNEDWYVEPEWCSKRLFDEEFFEGSVYDPCCGMGRIVLNARAAGHRAYGNDLVDRGFEWTRSRDFVKEMDEISAIGPTSAIYDNIVTNPPFDIAPAIVTHALALARKKVAIIFPTARLNAAHWISCGPLARIWLMTPRPSMPPGHVIIAGEKPGGGRMDFCWLVFDRGFVGQPGIRWLHRDGGAR